MESPARSTKISAQATLLVLALGTIAALLDSLSLITFIPLIHTITGATTSNWTSWRLLLWLEARGTLTILAVLCALVIAKNLCDFGSAITIKRTEGLIAHGVRGRIFNSTLTSLVERSDDHDQADILTILSDSSWKVGAVAAHNLKIVVAATSSAILLATMTIISPRLTGLALVLLILVALVLRSATVIAERSGRLVVRQNKALGARMLESLTGLQLIRAFGNEVYEGQRFAHASDALRRRMLNLDILWSLPGSLTEICMVIAIASLILAGQVLGVEVAVLVAFLSLLFRLQAPTRNIIENKLARDGMRGSIEDVTQFLERSERIHLVSGMIEIDTVATGITFENVWFRYSDTSPWALRDATFTIQAGQMTGIVGSSGSGKTTIMLLLYRFADPTAGRILIDGVPLTSLDLVSWRRQLALMAQEVHLLNTSVAENIGYGDLNADLGKIKQAARAAGIDDVISTLPNGYQTAVGTAGFRLSGGQRQRIALARVLLRNPAVLLLDEATNALDAESEEHFRVALDTFRAGRTIVAIAHRFTSLVAADQIIVIEKGVVIEVGPPALLLANPGRYAALLALQSIGDGP